MTIRALNRNGCPVEACKSPPAVLVISCVTKTSTRAVYLNYPCPYRHLSKIEIFFSPLLFLLFSHSLELHFSHASVNLIIFVVQRYWARNWMERGLFQSFLPTFSISLLLQGKLFEKLSWICWYRWLLLEIN